MKSIIITFILALPFALMAQKDVPGSQDHPLISRYPGSVIAYYDQEKFQEYYIATGPQTGYKKIDDWTTIAGKRTRIYYLLEGSASLTEVYHDYLQSLQKADFIVLAKGLHQERNVSKEIGGRTWLQTFYARNPIASGENISLLNGSATVGGSGFVAAKKEVGPAEAYVVLTVTQYTDKQVLAMVDIIETRPMETGKVKVNADYLLQQIRDKGSVAIYGIYFDFDKATIQPESKPILEEIAKLLKSNPPLNLYVVGHTDMKGSLAYNLNLSELRAKAVVDALVNDYGINRTRLEGKGVGPLAPDATNQNDDGRSLNRRVVLVEKI